ncbi:hypothetical protein UPYG_G00329410 [Umbra pygmaea]|uniref:Uncharacterized protein n=1 Tax=Umbra pygmaea TaxID=75934 RepID=A0ABD0W3H5_UMBPY
MLLRTARVIAEEEKKKRDEDKKKGDSNVTKQDNPEFEDKKDNDVTTIHAGKGEHDELVTPTQDDTTPTKEEATPLQTELKKESSSNTEHAGPPDNDNKEDEPNEDSESQSPKEHVNFKACPSTVCTDKKYEANQEKPMDTDQPREKNKTEVENKKEKEDGKSKDKLDPITDYEVYSQEAMDLDQQKDKGAETTKTPESQQDMELDQPTAMEASVTTTSPSQGSTDAKMDIDGGVHPDLKLNENITSPDLKLNENITSTSDPGALLEKTAQDRDDSISSLTSPDETPPTDPSIQY